MTKFYRLGAASVALAAALATVPAHAQLADNEAQAEARAEILSALTLDLEAGTLLDFGAVVIQDSAVSATLTMDADGTLDCSDANLVCSGANDVPVFNISGGSANATVKVNLPVATSAAPAYIYLGGDNTITDDTQRLEIYDFTSDATLNAATTVDVLDAYNNVIGSTPVAAYYSVNLDALGENSFTVGATLAFDGDEVPGVYSDNFTVSVEYQ